MGRGLKTITRDEFYDMIVRKELSKGDTFTITSNGGCFRETIFDVNTESGMVDTLVEFRTRPNVVGETRHVGSGRYSVDLEVNERGSKDYHNLLEATN